MNYREIDYDYFGRCLELKNDKCTMLIMIEKGPRVISFKLNGKDNIMCEDKSEQTVMTGGKFAEMFGDDKWFIYGGHRLWVSPEHDPKSYYPDNKKVSYVIDGNKVTLTPPPQLETDMQFSMEVEFSETDAAATVTHRINNIGNSNMTISPWAMTVVDKNAVSIMPQSEKQTGLLSNRNFTVWPYTDLTDDRLYIGNKYLTLQQVPGAETNIKIGFNDDKGWLASLNKGQLFIKRFPYNEGASYPDNNCNCEVFTNFFMMEIESLGELKEIQPDETLTHIEDWELIPCDDTFDRRDDKSIDEFVKKYIG